MKKTILFCLMLSVTQAHADAFSYSDPSRTKSLTGEAGIGFTISPDTFLMTVRSDYFLSEHIALGPLLQM
jgi:hypothetical protein